MPSSVVGRLCFLGLFGELMGLVENLDFFYFVHVGSHDHFEVVLII